jgi:hypothetical protein
MTANEQRRLLTPAGTALAQGALALCGAERGELWHAKPVASV